MIRERNLRATIGWLCAALVFAMYVFIPIIEFLINIDVASSTSILFPFLCALFMDAAKPARETEYRSFWLDGWLPMVGWICSFAFAWLILLHPVVVLVFSIVDFGALDGEVPVYSTVETFILMILMLRAALHQVFGKPLSDALNALLSRFVIPDG